MNGRQRIVRDRLNRLRDEITHDREVEIGRAVEFKNAGNDVLAAYHTGLADGRNTVLAELRALAKEYPGVLDTAHHHH